MTAQLKVFLNVARMGFILLSQKEDRVEVNVSYADAFRARVHELTQIIEDNAHHTVHVSTFTVSYYECS